MKKIMIFPGKLSRAQKALHVILWMIRVDLLLAAVLALSLGQWELLFMSLLAFVLTFIPELIESTYKINLPIEFDLIIVLIVYLSIFLGEAINAYERFFWWDAMLHIVSGIILAFAGFLILYILFRQKKFRASPFIIAMMTFSFGMALGALWEIFEFGMDQIFGLNMQKNGLSDTMWDLIVNALGALAVSWAGYRIVKNNSTDGIVYKALISFFKDNPKYDSRSWWRSHAN